MRGPWQAGIIVVASAGNFGSDPEGEVGYAGITSPGNAPSAITAGAFNHQGTAARGDDRLTSYSSRGPTWYDGLAKPDVVAPGHQLLAELAPGSALADTYPQFVEAGPSGRSYLRSRAPAWPRRSRPAWWR